MKETLRLANALTRINKEIKPDAKPKAVVVDGPSDSFFVPFDLVLVFIPDRHLNPLSRVILH